MTGVRGNSQFGRAGARGNIVTLSYNNYCFTTSDELPIKLCIARIAATVRSGPQMVPQRLLRCPFSQLEI